MGKKEKGTKSFSLEQSEIDASITDLACVYALDKVISVVEKKLLIEDTRELIGNAI